MVLEKTLQSPLDSILNPDDTLSLESILKIRDITLPTNVCLVKAMVFPVVLYRCESSIIKMMKKNAEELMLSNCGAGEDS